ncbi:hypothetical protein Tco_0827687 [Tanacetum coccineum]
MFLKSPDKIERYVMCLLDMIHRSVMVSKPKTMQDAIEFATELMDKKIRTLAERQAENKRKFDNNNPLNTTSSPKDLSKDVELYILYCRGWSIIQSSLNGASCLLSVSIGSASICKSSFGLLDSNDLVG